MSSPKNACVGGYVLGRVVQKSEKLKIAVLRFYSFCTHSMKRNIMATFRRVNLILLETIL